MELSELRWQILLALVDAVKAAAKEGNLKVRAYPNLGYVQLAGVSRELIQLAQAIEA